MSSDDEKLYINEIKRFVEAEKNFSSTSDSESASDNSSVKEIHQPVSSDSEDDYFNQKRRKEKQLAYRKHPCIVSSESSDENFVINHSSSAASSSEEDSVSSDLRHSGAKANIATSTPIQPPQLIGARDQDRDIPKEADYRDSKASFSSPTFVKGGYDFWKAKIKKKKRKNTRDETRRVDENIQKAKARLNRTVSGQSEWRQSRTFGLSVDIRAQPTVHPDQEKSEVQDVISNAVGEPQSSSSTHNNHNYVKVPNSLQIGHKQVQQPALSNNCTPSSSTGKRNQNEVRPIPTPPIPTPHFRRNAKEDEDYERRFPSSQHLARSSDSSYSPPSDSHLDNYSTDNLSKPSKTSRERSSGGGFKDTSRVPKSPWFKGKTPEKKPQAQAPPPPSEKIVCVPCVRVEEFVQFSTYTAPFVLIDGEKYTISPAQWHNIFIT